MTWTVENGVSQAWIVPGDIKLGFASPSSGKTFEWKKFSGNTATRGYIPTLTSKFGARCILRMGGGVYVGGSILPTGLTKEQEVIIFDADVQANSWAEQIKDDYYTAE